MRRTYFVNKAFQYRFIGYFVALTSVVLVPFWGGFLWFFHKFDQLGLELGLDSNHVFFRFLNAQRATLGLGFLVITLVVTLIMVIAGTLISHRIAGPLFKLRRELERIGGGERIEKITFRKKDFFPEICDSINPILEEINRLRDGR